MDNAWIQTFSNKKFHLLDPQPDEICIEDIAHALSLQCRFTGHTKFHYSVAQHCVYASTLVPSQFSLEALLHDAAEAYICDMSRPLKHLTNLGLEYLKIEDKIHRAIANKFGIPETISPIVKEIDNKLLYTEKDSLMLPMTWDVKWGDTENRALIEIAHWSPEFAERMYLDYFYIFSGF